MGRVMALQKANGGVRGIVAGDMVRRLVTRTIAQQIHGPVERASPFQYALSTRAGTGCIAHAIQAITDATPRATVLSADGISAYDTISRVAMLRGLRRMEGGDAMLPFVSQFYGSPSTCGKMLPRTCGKMKKDGSVRFGRAREASKGDALMPALFSLGQHGALEAIQARLRPSEGRARLRPIRRRPMGPFFDLGQKKNHRDLFDLAKIIPSLPPSPPAEQKQYSPCLCEGDAFTQTRLMPTFGVSAGLPTAG